MALQKACFYKMVTVTAKMHHGSKPDTTTPSVCTVPPTAPATSGQLPFMVRQHPQERAVPLVQEVPPVQAAPRQVQAAQGSTPARLAEQGTIAIAKIAAVPFRKLAPEHLFIRFKDLPNLSGGHG
jgi:hypothetical protein